MKEHIFWNKGYTVRNRVIAHIIFWVIYFYFLRMTYLRYDPRYADLLVTKDMITVVIIFYLTAFIAIPKWFLNGKLIPVLLWSAGAYFIYPLFTFIMAWYADVNRVLEGRFRGYVDLVLDNGWYAGILPTKISVYLPDFAFMVALPVGLKLSQSFVMQAVRKTKLERDNLTLELKLLKSQINPHFLFNSLNNIHRMVNKSDPRTADTVLSLASLMRYTLYESNERFVSLNEELKFLQNYIDLQLLRYGDKVDIKVELPWVDEGFKIAPLILFPFIENAFKHGPDKSQRNAWVHINITLEDEVLDCQISNSISRDSRQDEVGGLGVENSKRRLELYYKNNHQLNIEQSAREHCVGLNVKVQFDHTKSAVDR